MSFIVDKHEPRRQIPSGFCYGFTEGEKAYLFLQQEVTSIPSQKPF